LTWNASPHLQETQIGFGTDPAAGTLKGSEHLGHLIFLPASSSFTLSFAPHEHFTSIAMALPRNCSSTISFAASLDLANTI
jgi:hypothetical protein